MEKQMKYAYLYKLSDVRWGQNAIILRYQGFQDNTWF